MKAICEILDTGMVDKESSESLAHDITIDGSLTDDRCEFLLSLESESEKLERKGFGLPKDTIDKASFARAAISMANTLGGYILLGVENNGNLKGIQEDTIDPADLNNIASTFVSPEIKTITCRIYQKQNAKVGIVFVPPSDIIPHITKKDGKDISKDKIYVRHSGQSEQANYDDFQRIILKACTKRQKEIMKHLEESELHKNVREIKEYLLGKDERSLDITTIIYMEPEDYISGIESLIDDEKFKELNNIVRILKKEIIKNWKSTRSQDKQSVQGIKELNVIPFMNKLTYIALLALENNFEGEIISNFLQACKDIYELSNQKDLGYRNIGEWILDNKGRPLKAKDHLSYTVPSKEMLKRIFILCGFAVRKKKFGELQGFCNLEVYTNEVGQDSIQPILYNPNYSSESGEGSRTTTFDEARELMVQDKMIYKFFDDEMEASLNDLVTADFLLGFVFFIQGKDNKLDEHLRIMNFPRLYFGKLAPLVNSLRKRPDMLGHDFPKFNEQQLKDYVLKSIKFSERYYFPINTSWNYSDFKPIFGN